MLHLLYNIKRQSAILYSSMIPFADYMLRCFVFMTIITERTAFAVRLLMVYRSRRLCFCFRVAIQSPSSSSIDCLSRA